VGLSTISAKPIVTFSVYLHVNMGQVFYKINMEQAYEHFTGSKRLSTASTNINWALLAHCSSNCQKNHVILMGLPAMFLDDGINGFRSQIMDMMISAGKVKFPEKYGISWQTIQINNNIFQLIIDLCGVERREGNWSRDSLPWAENWSHVFLYFDNVPCIC